MRIAIAELKQETNTFVPFTTTLKTFEEQYLYRGDEILTAFGKARLEVPGALDAIRRAGATACRCWPPWRWPRAWWSARASTS